MSTIFGALTRVQPQIAAVAAAVGWEDTGGAGIPGVGQEELGLFLGVPGVVSGRTAADLAVTSDHCGVNSGPL